LFFVMIYIALTWTYWSIMVATAISTVMVMAIILVWAWIDLLACSPNTCKYLTKCWLESALMVINEGLLPLHYAYCGASLRIIQSLAQACPMALNEHICIVSFHCIMLAGKVMTHILETTINHYAVVIAAVLSSTNRWHREWQLWELHWELLLCFEKSTSGNGCGSNKPGKNIKVLRSNQ